MLDERGDAPLRPGGHAGDALGLPQRRGERDPLALGPARDELLGLVADAALGHVEDAPQADRVLRVGQHPQVGQRVAHLAPLVEPHAADHLVRQPDPQEHVLEHARLAVGAVEDGHVGVADLPGIDQPVDLPGDERGLVVLVVGDVADHLLAVALVGPQALVAPIRVAGDHRVGRREDALGGAVVLLQQDRDGVGEVLLELDDVADAGAAEGVDGLVGIAHHAQLARRHARRRGRHQLADQLVLGVVGVLVLVDEHVAEPAPVVLGDGGQPLQQRHRLHDQVVEVERVGRAQAGLVDGVDLGDLALELHAWRARPRHPG